MKIFVGIFVSLGLSGCMVSSHDYGYIYLGEKMIVTASGKSAIGSLYFHDEMPIEYELRRSGYTIKATLDRESVRPAVFIGVEEDTEREISITGEFASPCFGNFLDGHSDIYRPGTGDLYFIWKESRMLHCTGESELALADHYLTITVLDFSGQEIAQEVIPFSIMKNGMMLEYDF